MESEQNSTILFLVNLRGQNGFLSSKLTTTDKFQHFFKIFPEVLMHFLKFLQKLLCTLITIVFTYCSTVILNR